MAGYEVMEYEIKIRAAPSGKDDKITAYTLPSSNVIADGDKQLYQFSLTLAVEAAKKIARQKREIITLEFRVSNK